MRTLTALLLTTILALVTPAIAQPAIDGDWEPGYCDPIIVQDTQTNFGDANDGQVDVNESGSELDAAYAYIHEGVLYLLLAGNLQSNSNKLEIFFDTRDGGQNQLRGDNPDVDFNGLNRMGDDPETPDVVEGLIFDADFAADYWVSVANNLDAFPTVALYVNYAELYVDEMNPGEGYFVGEGRAANFTNQGELTGGNNPFDIRCTLNNSNTEGVAGGTGLSVDPENPDEVLTGIEIAIPLEAIGNPTDTFKICAFVNGQGHDFVSNQILGGIFAWISDNLGDPRFVSFDDAIIPFAQFFEVPLLNDPCGACCIGQDCSILTENDCLSQGGTWLGSDVSCDGNPCDTIPTGACCIGLDCVILTENECLSQGGEYLGDDTTCEGNPCLLGACCIGQDCFVLSPDDCAAQDGQYQGDGTTCDPNPCIDVVCCYFDHCYVISEILCNDLGGTVVPDAVDCAGNPCDSPEGQPVIDGNLAGDGYTGPIVVQDTQTGFGDAIDGLPDFNGSGSELDAAYAKVAGDYLYLLLTGNLQSNSNKLEIFFDTRDGGQNQLRGDNPDVDFNGLNRMGDDPATTEVVEGLIFDAEFAADFWVGLANNPNPPPTIALYVNYAELRIDDENPGTGYYVGQGRAVNQSNGGLLDKDLGGGFNPFGLLATFDNSNVEGVIGGNMLIGPDENPADVMTGIEIAIPLAALGNPEGTIKVCTFINGQAHDFVSNQVLAPISAAIEGNLEDPRFVSFADDVIPNPQFFEINLDDPCAGQVIGDANCDGVVNNFDIDAFVLALTNGQAAWEATYGSPTCTYFCVNDIDGNGAVNNFDIDPFVTLLTGK